MRYQVGRVLLAGDAAHIHSPVGGQGLNTGVQDAYNLGWKLAQVLQGKADARLLATYTRERLPIAQETLGRAEGLQNVLLAPDPLLRVVRTYALAPLVRLRPVIERVIKANAQLSVRYRRSSLASNRDRWPWRTGWRGPRAGDRAPGGPGLLAATGMQTNLFHSFRGPQWTLLLFAGRTPTAQTFARLLQISGQAQQRLRSDVKSVLVVAGSALPARLAWEGEVVLDPTHTLHRRYGALRTGCYLVRPDKYIGLRAIPARVEAVATYLDQLVERPSPAPASSVSTLAGAA
jgi:hypothetical protein